MVRFKQTTTVLFWVATLFFSNSVQAGLLYSIVDLGTLGGTNSWGYGINDAGQVTGMAETITRGQNAFITNVDNKMLDLGTLGGDTSVGYGINNFGQVTGSAKIASPTWYTAYDHAFIAQQTGLMTDLGTLGGNISVGRSINNAGQVVGYARDSDGRTHGFINTSGVMTDLGFRGFALDINDSGLVTGSYLTTNGSYHALITNSDGNLTDLGTLGGYSSEGAAVNASGIVVGHSDTGRPYFTSGGTMSVSSHAFVTDSLGNMTDLGTLGGYQSIALDINDLGQIVGNSTTSILKDYFSQYEKSAFVTENGVLKDLNSLLNVTDSGWFLTSAEGINNSGQITGYGFHDGATRAFLLTPVSAVPEPWDICLFISGLLGLFSVKPRSKQQLTE